MNSYERVWRTVHHKEPDRVPVGEWGLDHDHVSRIIGHETYWRNRKATTLALWDGRRDEVVDSMKHDCIEFVDALEHDIIALELVPPKNYRPADPPRSIGDGVWQDSTGITYKYAASNDSIVQVSFDEGEYELTEEEIENYIQQAGEIDESQFEVIDYVADHYKGSKALVCRSIDVFDRLVAPYGGDYAHHLMITCTDPDGIKMLYEACMSYNRKLLEHCRQKGIMIAMHGSDFGMKTGCIIAPKTLRELIFPLMKLTNEETVRQGIIPFYHCCGNINEIIDDYVKAGYKGYQSIQESAGMNTRQLKEQYGDILTLWTGVQCETLVAGSLEATEAEVKRNLEFLKPNGGFIFGSTNSVQFGAKTENYLKALELVRKYGGY